MDKPEEIVPAQRKGGRSSTRYSIKLRDPESARKKYARARENFIDVNRWHDIAGPLSAAFQLTDNMGKIISGPVQTGNYFRIEMPAVPGNPEGRGYDWVKVEAIEEENGENHQWTAIRVRPAKPPINDSAPATAHFFTNEASSSFCIERSGTRVTASVFGRNEKPNTSPPGFFSRIRNMFIAVAAILGMSKTQWKSLVKGIIEK